LVRSEGHITYITLSRRRQISISAVLMAGAAAIGFLSVGYVHFGKVVARDHAEMARTELSNADLRRMVSALQTALESANASLEAAQRRLASVGNQYGSLQGSLSTTEQQLKDLTDARDNLLAQRDELVRQLNEIAQQATAKDGYAAALARNLEASQAELQQNEAQREALTTQLHDLEKELQSAAQRVTEFKSDLDTTERKMQQVSSERERMSAERDRIAEERDQLRQKLHDLETRLAKVDSLGSASPVAQPPPESKPEIKPQPRSTGGTSVALVPADTSRDVVGSTGTLGDLEALLSTTGLDVESMMERLMGTPKGEGGPYIALNGGKVPPTKDTAQREELLRKLLHTLPLASPLAHYQMESPFGPRIDPLNHREGFHPGVDLAAEFRSPVYSTAPGVVTFAGVHVGYGKYVEIDHGMGIMTHYAHLHRITVARGQRVAAHQEVGELGSTGRSTGPHLHYEIVVDGEPVDPAKFLEVGKSVVQVNNK
jgi:murein DD-endopeptidase MepM/ murein hydrolase activator NlpD